MKKQNTYEKKLKAWHKKYGDFSPQVKSKLDRLIEQYSKNQSINIKQEKVVQISVGTKLIREFKGRRHEVIAKEKGFEYKGQNYNSLSAIANEITGTRWNGKKFFGVCK